MTTNTRPVRRAHKKSRNGCTICKGRHIKCDETHPSCTNCSSINLSCTYRTTAASPLSSNHRTPPPSNASQTHSPAAAASISTPILDNNEALATNYHEVPYPTSHPPGELNMLHLILLHHASSKIFKDFNGNSIEAKKSCDAAISVAFEAPFLMFELLALSALHLSTLRPDQKEFYSNEAAQLQTQALAHFNNLSDTYKSSTPIPIFMFSSFLGIHVLFDTLLFRPADFGIFIDRFVGYLRLHRGTCTLGRGAYSLIRGSEEHRHMIPGTDVLSLEKVSSKNECATLKSLIQSADLSQASVNACQQAIDLLQWSFDSSRPQPSTQSEGSTSSDGNAETGQVDTLFAWPITIPLEFTELILQRKPEALAILAHYGVLLHQRRDFWIIQDGGEFLISAIVRYLGSYWEHWLELPMSIL